MNFKDWEKLAEDDKSVKLRHPKGHEMTIALKALPKIQQEMVKRLKFAKGGDVLDSGEDGESEQGKTVRHANKTKADLKQAKEEAKGRAQMEKTVKPKLKGLAHGGVAHYDEGTPDQPVSQQDEAPQPQAQPAASAPPPVVNNIVMPGAATPQAPPAPQPPVQMPSSGTSPVAMPEQVKMAEPKQINGSSLGNEANQSLQSIEDAKTGLDNQAKVQGALSQAAIPVLQQKIKGEQQFQQGLQNNTNMITQQVQQFNDATKGGIINPKNYQESMGSGQKVRTAIGLFLGGMGVPFGGQNYAFEHLEKQIDRDIAAQQNTFQNRKSVLGAWQSLYGQNQIALNLAKASLIDNTANQLDLQAKALGTQSALNNAAAGKQVLMEKSAQLRNEAASLATKAGINGKPPGKTNQQEERLSPTDPRWGDEKGVKPWSDKVPKANPPQPVSVDYEGLKRNQQLGAKGVPGYLAPGEVGEANQAAGLVEASNEAIKEIHKQFPEMWKNASVGNDTLRYIGDQHALGVHLPDFSDWTTEGKRYGTAASAVKKQLANVVAGGGSEELYKMIENQLPAYTDSPSDYRQKLENVENVLRQQALKHGSVLKKYNLIKGMPNN